MKSKLVEIGLLVAASLAALANYEGLAMTIRAETLWQHCFCAAIAIGVFSSIGVFWHVAFHIVPDMQNFRLRLGTWATTATGAVLILGMSAWWSVSALGGEAAQQAAYQEIVAEAEQSAALSRASGGAFQALIPGLDALASDLGRLAACEDKSGCITSSGGSGGVASLLSQLRDKATTILNAASEARTGLIGGSDKAGACLVAMRGALSSSEPMRVREDALARQADCVNGALADLNNIDGGAGIAQALATFTSGVVMPVGIKTDKQKAAVEKILSGITARTAGLEKTARATMAAPAAVIRPVIMTRINATQAVMRYASAVIPAWVTGICLDLAPLALLMLISLKAMADRARPEDAFQSRPIRDIFLVRRALAELEGPQRRPTPKGMLP